MMANLGGVLPSLIGPQMVTDPFNNAGKITKDSIAQEIYFYMLVYFILAVITFAVFFWHFPDNPNEPLEENDEIHDVKSQCLKVLKSHTCLSILAVASLGSIPHIWGSTLLTVTLAGLKITQEFVGLVTTLTLIFSTIFTLAVSRIADLHFKHNLKTLIMILMPVHALTMIGLGEFISIGSPNANYKCNLKILI